MQVIPLTVTPSQTVNAVLSSQSCKINVYQKSTGLFCDLYVNDVLVIGGVITENVNRIVRSLYLGFSGDLIFFDTQGLSDPDYTQLGTRFLLIYLAAAEVAAMEAARRLTLAASAVPFVPLPTNPSPPIGLAIAGGIQQDVITWTPVTGLVYDLYWSLSPGVTIGTGTKISDVTSGYTHTALSDNTRYYYILEATNVYGKSAVSTEASGLTMPAAPTGLTATGSLGQVTVGWTMLGGLSYNLYYNTTPGVTPGTGIKVADVGSLAAVTGLANNTEYFFILTAVNATGEGAQSAEVNATTAAVPVPVWTLKTAAGNYIWRGVANNGTIFAAVAQTGGGWQVMTSPDATTWTIHSISNTNYWLDVCWGNGQFVAIANTGTKRAMTSTDGITWTAQTTPVEGGYSSGLTWNRVVWTGTQYVAVANGDDYSLGSIAQCVMTSPDGITWTLRTAHAGLWTGLAWNGTILVAVSTGGEVMTSSDGITWTLRVAAAANGWRAVCWSTSLSLFVAVAQSGISNRVMTSPDGITWTSRVTPNYGTWTNIVYGNGKFVAISADVTNITTMYSMDGITWTPVAGVGTCPWWGLTFLNGLFVAVGGNPGAVMVSS